MTADVNPSRLCTPDPWSVVNEARAQRGPIVARWFLAAAALACSLRFWTRAGRRPPSAIPS